MSLLIIGIIGLMIAFYYTSSDIMSYFAALNSLIILFTILYFIIKISLILFKGQTGD